MYGHAHGHWCNHVHGYGSIHTFGHVHGHVDRHLCRNVYGHVYRHVYRHALVHEVCLDMCMDMRIDMCRDICTDMCTNTRSPFASWSLPCHNESVKTNCCNCCVIAHMLYLLRHHQYARTIVIVCGRGFPAWASLIRDDRIRYDSYAVGNILETNLPRRPRLRASRPSMWTSGRTPPRSPRLYSHGL